MSFVRCTAGLLLCACLILLPGHLSASDRFNGAWASFYTSGSLAPERSGGDWRFNLYGDTRYYDRLEGINQYVLQPGIGYRLNERLSLWGGYTWFRSEVDGITSVNEHRAWQQVSWSMAKWTHATLKSRTRLEERFRDGRGGTDLRLRQLFRLDARFEFSPMLTFILGNESFHHLRDTGWTRKGYGQNRLYAGVGFNFWNVRAEALYMNQQYLFRDRENLVSHLAVLNFKL